MDIFTCPVCKKPLYKENKSLKCENMHCFDISRKGTVNLLLSAKANHGDDKRMVSARKAFMDKGYYEPLHKDIRELTGKYAHDNSVILDCGCGECSYTADISRYLRSTGKHAEIIGIDVSKEAINTGASRHENITLAVASVYAVPLADKSCDIVLSLFAPFAGSEYLRLLKRNGIYITAFPLKDHLFELKAAIYESPYLNNVSPLDIEGFELIENKECRFKAMISSNEDITALFEMTPYCYKTSREDRAKLDKLDRLDVTASFGIAVYRPISV